MKSQKARNLVLVCLLSLSLSFFGVGVQHLLAQDEPTTEPTGDDMALAIDDPQSCAECHIDVTLKWESSDHAMTFHSDGFQSAISDGADASCFECHATGYTAFNGEYTHESVSCEACHGDTPANHPDEPISVAPGLDVCADCHTTTHQEWETSAHGQDEIPCTGCHDPHGQTLRFETTQQLCVNCHQEELTGYAHISHEEQMCSDCHWHRGELDTTVHLVTGALGPSGHDAQVETLACTDCHSGLDENITVVDTTEAESTDLRLRTQALEIEVENVRAQGENAAAVRLVQGLVVGLAGGAVLMFIFVRLSPGRHVKEMNHDE